MLILVLPQKQNGRPIGYITLLKLILGVRDIGKVPNQKVAKLRIVLLVLALVFVLLLVLFLDKSFALS